MDIPLSTPVSFEARGVPYVGITSLTFLQSRDIPDDKTVWADTGFGAIVLWSGVEYSTVGDYTQQQIYNKLRWLMERNPKFQ